MKAQIEAHRLYDVTVSGVTATLDGPGDVVAMYRKMRGAYPPDLSVEIRSIDNDLLRRYPGYSPAEGDGRRRREQGTDKVDSHYGQH